MGRRVGVGGSWTLGRGMGVDRKEVQETGGGSDPEGYHGSDMERLGWAVAKLEIDETRKRKTNKNH